MMAESCDWKWWKKSFVLLTILLPITVTILVAAMTELTYRESQSRLNYTTEALLNEENFRTTDNVSGGFHSPDYSSYEIYPSRNDKKKYLFRVIPRNDLRVLLVWDPTAKRSAAAMSVGAGYHDDPATHEGLAHLCEHMLEMGSEKYPDFKIFKNFVKTYGGQYMAFTLPDYTLYRFFVPRHIFPTALDIFAQFFISPLFPEGILRKEIGAIHHEYLLKINNDESKAIRLLNYVSNPDNPGHQFGDGDNITLNKEDILSQLKIFFNDKYAASNVSVITIS